MAYGLSLDQVRKINEPLAEARRWGCVTALTSVPEYAMYRVDLLPGAAQPMRFYASAYSAFVELGEVFTRGLDSLGRNETGLLIAGDVFSIAQYKVHGLASKSGAVVYLFGARTMEGLEEHLVEPWDYAAADLQRVKAGDLPRIGHPTSDVREKYWGRIETIVSDEVAAKRIFVQKGGQGSLEYHVEKSETYYVHSGRVKVGLRIGRAENHSIVLAAGQSYDVRPGVMHLRAGLEDSVILEVSTRDSDADSYLVEDGQTYRHIDIGAQPELMTQQEQQRETLS